MGRPRNITMTASAIRGEGGARKALRNTILRETERALVSQNTEWLMYDGNGHNEHNLHVFFKTWKFINLHGQCF